MSRCQTPCRCKYATADAASKAAVRRASESHAPRSVAAFIATASEPASQSSKTAHSCGGRTQRPLSSRTLRCRSEAMTWSSRPSSSMYSSVISDGLNTLTATASSRYRPWYTKAVVPLPITFDSIVRCSNSSMRWSRSAIAMIAWSFSDAISSPISGRRCGRDDPPGLVVPGDAVFPAGSAGVPPGDVRGGAVPRPGGTMPRGLLPKRPPSLATTPPLEGGGTAAAPDGGPTAFLEEDAGVDLAGEPPIVPPLPSLRGCCCAFLGAGGVGDVGGGPEGGEGASSSSSSSSAGRDRSGALSIASARRLGGSRQQCRSTSSADGPVA
mmetsp:Transcript_14980/g.60133  ORF Transcript_14980/g.60133 Transcript_14980/m.60133 type:complete len:325 (-) Transcript_14980:164-1138(-)